jgi:hypothetical protein
MADPGEPRNDAVCLPSNGAIKLMTRDVSIAAETGADRVVGDAIMAKYLEIFGI